MALRASTGWQADLGREIVRAKQQATQEFRKAEPALRATFESVERYVKKHPKQAAAITLSLGAALGAASIRLLKSRKK